MKKIINGKRYDTDTAEAVGYWDSKVGKSSFRWYEETLYQKRGGEFFLYGYGHASSPSIFPAMTLTRRLSSKTENVCRSSCCRAAD